MFFSNIKKSLDIKKEGNTLRRDSGEKNRAGLSFQQMKKKNNGRLSDDQHRKPRDFLKLRYSPGNAEICTQVSAQGSNLR
jgi:malic enzyme